MKRPKNITTVITTVLLTAWLAAVPVPAFAQNAPLSVEERLKRMEQRQDDLERQLQIKDARIGELERQLKERPVVTADGTNYVTIGGFLMKVGVPNQPHEAIPAGTSAIHDYGSFAGDQNAAPRADNIPIDPSTEGFMPLFGSRTAVKLGGYARVDGIMDFQNNGNPNQFVPSTIPVDGQAGADGGERFQLHAKATRLSLELRRAAPGGKNLRIYYENDFYNNSSASSMDYRLRHFYGQAYNFLVGQTFTTFMDVDAFPDTVDFQGPNALINKRQPQIRYTIPFRDQGMSLAFAVEQPNVDLVSAGIPAGASGVNHAPDGVVAWRLEKDRWHIQASGILRALGYEQDGGSDETVLGWGGALAGALNVFANDKLTGGIAYGEGISRYINDAGGLGLDAALDAGGDLQALPAFAVFGGYSHQWGKEWRSTASYGYVWTDPEDSLGALAYEHTHYASANLIWQPTKAFRIGLEYLYGVHETQGGADGDGHRLNFVVKYDLVR